MDASRLFQLLLITLFSVAITLIGLNELSHRFMKTGMKEKEEEMQKGSRLVKELSGEINLLNPQAGRPTPLPTPAVSENNGEQVYGVVQSQWQKVVDKLLPK